MKHAILAAILLTLLSSPSGADFQSGLDAYNRGDFAAAFEEWKPLTEAGDAAAQFNLAGLYEKGRGVPRDGVRAFLWYRKAALKGNKPAAKAVARFERDRPDTVRKAKGCREMENYAVLITEYGFFMKMTAVILVAIVAGLLIRKRPAQSQQPQADS